MAYWIVNIYKITSVVNVRFCIVDAYHKSSIHP